MSTDIESLGEFAAERLRPSEVAWCALMLSVILASASTLGVFMAGRLYPAENDAVLRLDLNDLTPMPHIDL